MIHPDAGGIKVPTRIGWFVTDSPPFRWNIGFHSHRGQRPDLIQGVLKKCARDSNSHKANRWMDMRYKMLLLSYVSACRASNTGLFHYMGQHNPKN